LVRCPRLRKAGVSLSGDNVTCKVSVGAGSHRRHAKLPHGMAPCQSNPGVSAAGFMYTVQISHEQDATTREGATLTTLAWKGRFGCNVNFPANGSCQLPSWKNKVRLRGFVAHLLLPRLSTARRWIHPCSLFSLCSAPPVNHPVPSTPSLSAPSF